MPSGEKHYNWKGGVSKDKEYLNLRKRKYRLRKGITKKNRDGLLISKNPEYKRMQRKKYKYAKENAGKLSINMHLNL